MKKVNVLVLGLVFSLFFQSALAAEDDLRFMLENFEGSFRYVSGYGDVPTEWTPAGSEHCDFSKDTEAHHGIYGLHVHVTNDPEYYTVLERTFTDQPGRTIDLQIQINASTTHEGEATFDASYLEGNTYYYYRTTVYWYLYSSFEWRTIKLENFKVPSNGEINIRLKMGHGNASGYTDFYWDCLTYSTKAPMPWIPLLLLDE